MNPYFLFQRKPNYLNPKLFVFFGESNSGGLAPNSSATPAELSFRNLKILNNNTFQFESLKIGTNNLLGHIGLEYAMHTAHGMELELANKYDEGFFGNNQIFLCKAGAGGSKVQEWDVSGTYFQNFKNRVNKARELLFKNTPEDITFMLSIGINNRGVNDNWSVYKAGLQAIINNLKIDLNIPNPKICIMKFQFVTNLDMNLYNTVIDEVASEFGLETFDTTGLTKIQDGYHLDYLGMKGATNNFLESISETVDPSLLLDIPFNGDFKNKVVGGIQMEVAGGAPTFSNGSAVFNGSQSIKTATPLNIGTDKVTVCFWIKTTQTSLGIIGELSADFNGNNAFVSFINENAPDSVLIGDFGANGFTYGRSGVTVNNNVWHFVACTIDRALNGNAQNSVIIDGVESYQPIMVGDQNGVWDANTFFIGQRGGNSLGYVGEIKNFKLFNRVLTQQEIQDLMV